MTILAEVGDFFGHQFAVAAAVWVMACSAIFLNRRMLPHVGAALISMAFVAELINIVFLDQAMGLGAMGVMAIGALYFAFIDGMVRLFANRHFDIFVAGIADIWLGDRRFASVDIVARDAGHIIAFVCSRLP